MKKKEMIHGVVKELELRRNELPECLRDTVIETREIGKMNEPYTGLVFMKHHAPDDSDGVAGTPSINLNQFLEGYKNGALSAHDIVGEILAMLKDFDFPDVSQLSQAVGDYNWVKDHLFLAVYPANGNLKNADDIVYDRIGDFILVYRIRVASNASAAILVTAMNAWGISKEELRKAAMKCVMETDPARLIGMAQVMLEKEAEAVAEAFHVPYKIVVDTMLADTCLPTVEEEVMFVLSNTSMTNGASVIFYPGILKSTAQTLGEDYYILPSSIHEVILLRASSVRDSGTTAKELLDMVYRVNAQSVSAQDKLGDALYYYDAESDTMSRVG